MLSQLPLQNKQTFLKIRLISNRVRFKILELTQREKLSISELSSALKIAYTKCADYVSMLEKEGLIEKEKKGKEVLVKSNVRIKNENLTFVR